MVDCNIVGDRNDTNGISKIQMVNEMQVEFRNINFKHIHKIGYLIRNGKLSEDKRETKQKSMFKNVLYCKNLVLMSDLALNLSLNQCNHSIDLPSMWGFNGVQQEENQTSSITTNDIYFFTVNLEHLTAY